MTNEIILKRQEKQKKHTHTVVFHLGFGGFETSTPKRGSADTALFVPIFFLSFLYACGVYSRGRCLWEQIKFGNGKWTMRGVLSRPPTRARGLDAFEDIRFARSAPRRVLSRVARRGSTPCTLGRATEFEKYYYLFFCLFFDTLRLCVGPYRGGQKTIASLWKDKGAGKDFVSRFLSGPPHLYSKTVWLTVASSLSA